MHNNREFLGIYIFTVDAERFAGLNIHCFNFIEAFTEILSHCLYQKQLLFSIVKTRGVYIQGKTFTVFLKTVKV